MIPVGTDGLVWMAEQAGLPLVVQRGVEITCNGPARARCGDPPSLRAALALLTGVSESAPAVGRLLGNLEASGRGSAALAGHRVIGVRDGEVTRILCVPAHLRPQTARGGSADVDDLAAGVSHELANALGAILGWTALARRQATLAPSTERAIRLIETSARSARATALRMLETARGAATALEPVELTQVLRDTCGAIEAVAAEAGVTVALDTPRECTVRGSPGHLFTLLWNLLQNAVEATAAGGRVHVRASTRDTLARVEVEDEGEGVNGSIQERIFEPYFTTKAKGTGLGLWLARRAVDEMGGTLLLEDAAGRGSRFVVELPLAARRARRATGHDRRSGVRPRGDPRGARILVVDDDRPTRELLETALRLAGAIVESAAGAEEALALEGCFDLALVDLGLKDCRGDALLAELRGRGMVRRAALVSGAPAPPRLLPEATPDTWIRKPFEIDDVIAAVRYLLVPPGEADSARGDGT